MSFSVLTLWLFARLAPPTATLDLDSTAVEPFGWQEGAKKAGGYPKARRPGDVP